ncbi:sulfate transporter CysZ [Colwellia sp. D2M02]|uniref:sulfate transporter CysZ n=1 Tax=Colwellia sp. D2M02 TaxID=2841562 RepID=UPI001C0946C0|nr:sulfate transporter CysZ [Colwellia sp. D2M02]MBU2893805.1 sulfate transporter CysZ [Colwellia sp. D2M02]
MKKHTSTTTPIRALPVTSNGARYFFRGLELITHKSLRKFVFIPLLINIMLFSTALYFMVLELDHYMNVLLGWLPSWLDWLSMVLWPFAVLTILVVFSFIFSSAANWLAAPFNGLLSEKVEALLSGDKPPEEGAFAVIKDIPRTLKREASKLYYYLPRAIGFFIIMWFLPVIGQIIWFLFVTWMMAIQYKDYPFDNHKVPFNEMKVALKQKQGLSYSFGATIAIFSMLPIINFIVMPVAICGATAIWVDHYKNNFVTRTY